jgi:hypothetical protein
MAAFGLLESDFPQPPEEIEIWPENWDAATAFVSLSTQWRASMAGATGLDYGAIEPVLRLRGIPVERWPGAFDGIRIMEAEALDVMREAAEQS